MENSQPPLDLVRKISKHPTLSNSSKNLNKGVRRPKVASLWENCRHCMMDAIEKIPRLLKSTDKRLNYSTTTE